MEWDKTFPTKPGFYWMYTRDWEGQHTVVSVVEFTEAGSILECGSDYGSNMEEIEEEAKSGLILFSGPLIPPTFSIKE